MSSAPHGSGRFRSDMLILQAAARRSPSMGLVYGLLLAVHGLRSSPLALHQILCGRRRRQLVLDDPRKSGVVAVLSVNCSFGVGCPKLAAPFCRAVLLLAAGSGCVEGSAGRREGPVSSFDESTLAACRRRADDKIVIVVKVVP